MKRTFFKVLAAEKVIQHVFVTLAFLVDFEGIRGGVAAEWRILVAGGAFICVFFAYALYGLFKSDPRAKLYLLFGGLF